MTNKDLSIRMDDFNQMVPNSTWIRQVEGPLPRRVTLPLPIEGILLDHIDETWGRTLQAENTVMVTSISSVDPVRLYAGQAEYKIGDEWVGWRELCIRAIERRLKGSLDMSTAQIGAHLYSVATWIEAQGNRGHSDEELMIGLPSFPIRLLNPENRPMWEHIVFFGDGGGKHDYSGWGVHKRTPAHWWITWLDRFGLDHPQADDLMTAVWDEALAGHEKRAVKRAHKIYAGVDLEEEPTRDVAHKAAAMWLMRAWARHRSWQHRESREIWGLQCHLYGEAFEVFVHELQYRQDQQPEPRRSKKKTQAVRDDWATASSYFYPGIGFDAYRFYTQEYVKACCESDAVPDVSVDFEALPRGGAPQPD